MKLQENFHEELPRELPHATDLGTRDVLMRLMSIQYVTVKAEYKIRVKATRDCQPFLP